MKGEHQEHCVLHQRGAGFTGSCGRLFDDRPVLALAPGVAAGRSRADLEPQVIWVGTLQDGEGTSPLTLELYGGGSGILHTDYGWFAASRIATRRALTFDLDAGHEVGPDALDRAIVQRAAALLSTDAWDRDDDRDCPTDAASWSLYCALQRATVEVTGGDDHRRPAMEVVRQIVDERSAGRDYPHRLMGYNNDPTTRWEDVQSLFREALADMDDAAWLAGHGFAAGAP